MKIHVWGTDFRRSSPELRAKLFIPFEKRPALLKELLPLGFYDLVYLSTCNRVEFYTTAEDYFCDTRRLWFSLLKRLELSEEDYYRGYHLEGKSALRHLIRVGASLESLVIGETQILGQLKEALSWSKTNSIPVHKTMERDFQFAFEVAKKIRTQTLLGEKAVSVASLALRELEASEKAVPLKRVVIVGRSPMSVTPVQWLLKNRPSVPILWVNRNVEKLREFPESQSVQLMSLQDFLQTPPGFSHMITATSSPEPVFDTSFFEKVDRDRKVILDLAQPPDVNRASVPKGFVRLVHFEELNLQAKENADSRSNEVVEAERLTDEAIKEYFLEQKEAPLLRDFSLIEPQFMQELQSVIQFIESEFPQELHSKLNLLAEKLVKKNLHHSREHLKYVLRRVSAPDEEVRVV